MHTMGAIVKKIPTGSITLLRTITIRFILHSYYDMECTDTTADYNGTGIDVTISF
jgi:hypothetical protein